jgi:membrane protein required for colicin V production
MTALDFVFIVTVIISALYGYLRGLITEIFALLAWVGAAIGTKYISVWLEPNVADLFGGSGFVTQLITYVSVFIILFIVISIFSKKSQRRIEASDYEGMDKALGFLFGILRGILVIALVYLLAIQIYNTEQVRPNWLKKAKSRPILRMGAQVLAELFWPGKIVELERDIKRAEMAPAVSYNTLKKPAPVVSEPPPKDESGGYKPSERRDLEKQLNIIQSVDFGEE